MKIIVSVRPDPFTKQAPLHIEESQGGTWLSQDFYEVGDLIQAVQDLVEAGVEKRRQQAEERRQQMVKDLARMHSIAEGDRL